MTDKNTLNPADFLPVVHQLHLTALSAINQKIAVLYLQKLTGLMPAIGRSSRISS